MLDLVLEGKVEVFVDKETEGLRFRDREMTSQITSKATAREKSRPLAPAHCEPRVQAARGCYRRRRAERPQTVNPAVGVETAVEAGAQLDAARRRDEHQRERDRGGTDGGTASDPARRRGQRPPQGRRRVAPIPGGATAPAAITCGIGLARMHRAGRR